jgi:hypothetical protein
MLGKALKKSRQGGWWAFCCDGHDGRWKDYIKANRSAQRVREKRFWRKDQD